MPIPEQTPQEAAKPPDSNTSTPVLAGNDEWFEDAILRALKTHNAKQAALAEEPLPFS